MVHSVNLNFRYVPPETPYFMIAKKDEPPIMMEMNDRNRLSMLVEVFECLGQVDFTASSDFSKFVANESTGAEHAKTAGHYAIKLPFSPESELQFARIKAVPSELAPNAMFIYRYSYFPHLKYPFSMLTLPDNAVSYHF